MANAPEFDWHLAEWLKSTGTKQADLIRALGWSKAKASDVVTGKQRYTRDLVNEVAAFLKIRPFELLLTPQQAYDLRGIRETAARIASSREPDDRTGTEG